MLANVVTAGTTHLEKDTPVKCLMSAQEEERKKKTCRAQEDAIATYEKYTLGKYTFEENAFDKYISEYYLWNWD